MAKSNNKHWSDKDTQFLIDNYKKLNIKVLALRLHRTEDAIRWRASELGLTEIKNYWTKEELVTLSENLSTLSYKELADKLRKSVRAVAHKISSIKIANNFKSPKLDALENNVAYFKGKAGEYKMLLSSMEVGQSFVYPNEERQTVQNQINHFPDRVYRTKIEDDKTVGYGGYYNG